MKRNYMPRLEKPRYAKRRRSGHSSLLGARRLVRKAVHLGLRTALLSEQKAQAAPGITQQYDAKTLYKRRRPSRKAVHRRKRRYKNFINKQLLAVNWKSNLYNGVQSAASGVNLQQLLFITSGAFSGPLSDQLGNLISLVQNDQNAANVSNIAYKYYLTSISTDHTFVNDSAGTMELDIYEWVARKDPIYTDASNAIFNNMVTTYMGNQPAIGGAGTVMTQNTLGWTPFDCAMLCRVAIIKSKRRYYISPGQTVSYIKTKKMKKAFKIPMEKSDDIVSTATEDDILRWCPGVTHGVICIYKGVPSATNACGDSVTLRSCSQCTYKFKKISDERPETELGSNV